MAGWQFGVAIRLCARFVIGFVARFSFSLFDRVPPPRPRGASCYTVTRRPDKSVVWVRSVLGLAAHPPITLRENGPKKSPILNSRR